LLLFIFFPVCSASGTITATGEDFKKG